MKKYNNDKTIDVFRQPRKTCLVCSRSGRQEGFHSILEDCLTTADSPSVLQKLNQVFGFSISDHMKVERGDEICKKCHKTLVEMVELEDRLKKMKEGLVESFFHTTVKVQRLAAAEERRMFSEPQNTPLDFSRSGRVPTIQNYNELKISNHYETSLLIPKQECYSSRLENTSGSQEGFLNSNQCHTSFQPQSKSTSSLIEFYHPALSASSMEERRDFFPFPSSLEDARNIQSDEDNTDVRDINDVKVEGHTRWKREADRRWNDEGSNWNKFEDNSWRTEGNESMKSQTEECRRTSSPPSSGYESTFSTSTEPRRPMKKRKHTESEAFSANMNKNNSSSNSSRSNSNGSCNDTSMLNVQTSKSADQ